MRTSCSAAAGGQAIELATRGQIKPADAALIIVEAEQTALRMKPLATVDRSIAPLLLYETADRTRAHLLRVDDRVVGPERTEDAREHDAYTVMHDGPFEDDEPEDRDAT